ncbi:Asp-tRNA(Asn)/Glu-tRNA(Gln) amidotransferase subunit GatC [Marinicellulosiphila megalodicopiae]|uniref:Asp-tRNA(Asn)/Glu-tRNA(Gln) amidotransferase subunit GatC n=1 Tax=Marinicellulosiphila megalodicopiae TaxID=2724896 RepID=UPI003BAFF973
MSLTIDEVKNIAYLARVGVSEEDLPKNLESLNKILSLVDQLQSVNTDGIEPLANPLDATQRLRADVITEKNDRENLLSNAPSSEAGLFLVPKVVE